MTTEVRIECGCGQHYAFEVEPVDGRRSAAVQCPVCGADGTSAANEVLAESMTARNWGVREPGRHLTVRRKNRFRTPGSMS